jgi:hypothetical protein
MENENAIVDIEEEIKTDQKYIEDLNNHPEMRKDSMTEEEIDPSYLNTQKNANLNTDKISTIKPILLEVNHNLHNIFMFSNTHVSNILYIFKKFNEIVFRKFGNTLNQNKQFVQFFQNMTMVYKNFSTELAKSNEILNGNNSDTLLSMQMNNLIEVNQQLIAKNFTQFSNSLIINVISKGPFTKIKDLINRYNTIVKEINLYIEKVENKKDKIAKKFNTKLSPILDSFKKNYNDDERLSEIIKKNDFYLIEVELINSISKMYNRLKIFLNNYKDNINKIKDILFEFMNLIKETIEIYINENKTIFSDNIFVNLESMKCFKNSISKEQLENAMSLENIIHDDSCRKLFSEMLLNYQSNLLRFKDVKNISNEDKLSNEENFDVLKMQSIVNFVDNFINFMPLGIDLDQKSLLVSYVTNVKRNPGVFSTWKNSMVVITLQDFLIIFDDRVSKKFANRFRLDKIKIKMKEDKKSPYKFELSETRKVLFFNSTSNIIIDPVTKDRFDEIAQFTQKAK